MSAKSEYRSTPTETTGLPKGIPYIVGNEAAERFSFYGMRTILIIFMVKYLHLMGAIPGMEMSRAAAVEKSHLFVTAVYFTPLIGALIADIFFGKYRTIVWLSIVYCLGHGALAFMGVTGSAGMWLFAGLALISMGAGGIKPCVSAHVGDQFGQSNRHLMTRVFNWFYWSINLGAFVSTLATPWLLHWYGPHWAFGVPGVLMALATFVFWLGRRKFIHIPAKGAAWFGREVFSKEGLAAMGKLAIIYIFVAIFWALFDQTMSSWVLQADDMDRNWLGITWLPSQIQLANPLLILTFIPLFTYVIYPAISKVFPLTPMRKISIGLFIMTIGFSIVAVTQEWIDGGARPSIAWQILAFAFVTAAEIMISIVCLEFSYTQAPKSMKSWIMALFLVSVSVGNAFTASVNHFIQVPNTLGALVSPESGEGRNPGFDGKANTADDIVEINNEGEQESLSFQSKDVIDQAADKIEAFVESNEWRVPTREEASGLLKGLVDSTGKELVYTIVNSRKSRVYSSGPDGEAMTRWDEGATISVEIPEPKAKAGFFDKIKPERPWLDTRKLELGLNVASADGAESSVSRDYFIGGQTKLEGAAYFWFFTWLMLGTAIIFVVVAYFYKPREYFHDDNEAESEAEGVGA